MRERAIRIVLETINETGERHGVVTRVGLELGIGSETLRLWGGKSPSAIGTGFLRFRALLSRRAPLGRYI